MGYLNSSLVKKAEELFWNPVGMTTSPTFAGTMSGPGSIYGGNVLAGNQLTGNTAGRVFTGFGAGPAAASAPALAGPAGLPAPAAANLPALTGSGSVPALAGPAGLPAPATSNLPVLVEPAGLPAPADAPVAASSTTAKPDTAGASSKASSPATGASGTSSAPTAGASKSQLPESVLNEAPSMQSGYGMGASTQDVAAGSPSGVDAAQSVADAAPDAAPRAGKPAGAPAPADAPVQVKKKRIGNGRKAMAAQKAAFRHAGNAAKGFIKANPKTSIAAGLLTSLLAGAGTAAALSPKPTRPTFHSPYAGNYYYS